MILGIAFAVCNLVITVRVLTIAPGIATSSRMSAARIARSAHCPQRALPAARIARSVLAAPRTQLSLAFIVRPLSFITKFGQIFYNQTRKP